MHCLLLNLASHSGTIACVDETHIVHSVAVDHRIDDQQLMQLLEQLLKDARWSYQDLTHLACAVGPGGFTSLRVGVACVNALSWALHIPACGMHLSDLFQARMPTSSPSSHQEFWLHSTKKQEIFVRGLGATARQFPDAECVKIDAFLASLGGSSRQQPFQWTGELIPEHREQVMAAGAREISLSPLQEILPRFLTSQNYSKETLTPWYGRGW